MLTSIARASVRRVLARGLPSGHAPAAQLAAFLPSARPYMPAAAVRSFGVASAARSPADKSRTSTTKTKKAAPKKGPRKAKAKAKPKKRTKKALTPEEKARADIRGLKEKALLNEPKLLPQTAWLVYTAQGLTGVRLSGSDSASSKIKELAQSYKSLSSLETQRLQATAEQNKLTNIAAHKAWVESHSPADIHEANQARARLKRVYKQPRRQIVDERQPKRSLSAYMFYVKERYASGDFVGKPAPAAAKAIAQEWRGLSASQKQTYVDQAKTDLDRYEKEAKRILNKTVVRKDA